MKFWGLESVRQWWKTLEKYPSFNGQLSILWLLLLSWIAFLWNLGNTGLVDETEPLFAEAARQMTVTGDWITPYFNGETRFDKPPLIYWLMAIGYKLIGVNEWAVRLPSALAAIALMGLGFYTLRKVGYATPSQSHPDRSQRQLWLAAGIGATLISLNLETLIWAHIGVSDMLLSGCLGMSLFSFFLGYIQPKGSPSFFAFPHRWYLAFYIFLALGVLTKGPVAIVLPGLIILLFLAYVGRLGILFREMGAFWGSLIFLSLTVPWYVLVIVQNGRTYIDSFFGYHNFERFTGVVNEHSAPWYFYFAVILVGFAPWSVYLPVAIARIRFWQRSFWQRQPRSYQFSLFAFFWFIGIFGFFTLAQTKLPSYVLPLMSAAAILVALLWSDELTRPQRQVRSSRNSPNWGLLLSGIANIILLLLLAAVFWYSPSFIGKDPAIPNLPQQVAQSGFPQWGAIVWLSTAIATTFLLIRKSYWRWLWSANLLGFLAFIIIVLNPITEFIDDLRQLPLRELSAQIVQVQQPQEEIVMIGFTKPSLVFYTQKPIKFFTQTKTARVYFSQPFTISDVAPTVLLVARSKFIDRLELRPQDYESLGQKSAYYLLRVSRALLR